MLPDPRDFFRPITEDLKAELPAIFQALPGFATLVRHQAEEQCVRGEIERLFSEAESAADEDRRDDLNRELARLAEQVLPVKLATVEQASADVQRQMHEALRTRFLEKTRAAMLEAGFPESAIARAMGTFLA